MRVEKIEVKINNYNHVTDCYLVYDEINKEGCVIDPGCEAKKILDKIYELGLKIKYVVITHYHADHISGIDEIINETQAKLATSIYAKTGLYSPNCNYSTDLGLPKQKSEIDILLDEGDSLKIAEEDLLILRTQGHTASDICICCNSLKVIFTGDILFADGYGRTDLATGDFESLKKSVKMLLDNYADYEILPGHGKSAKISDISSSIRMLLCLDAGRNRRN